MANPRVPAATLLAAALASAGDVRYDGPEPAGGRVVLWAWERREDVSFASEGEGRVAVLAATLRLSPSGLEVSGRRQPLRTAPGARAIPVARIEVAAGTPASRLSTCLDAVVGALRVLVADAPALQIDFDARQSERGFYADLLRRLRATLPPRTRLSMTALTSWCLGDPWIAALPVDEAVPMLFRMGPEGPALRARLARGEDFGVLLCRGSYGLSADEPIPRLRPGRAIYLFSPTSWSPAIYADVRRRALEATR